MESVIFFSSEKINSATHCVYQSASFLPKSWPAVERRRISATIMSIYARRAVSKVIRSREQFA